MTNEEYQAAVAKLIEVDTEAAALTAQERDCIEKAREFNDATKAARNKRTALLKTAEPLRAALAEHAQEARRQAVAKATAEAEERAKANAAKAKEPSEIEKLTAEVAELRKELAAKE